MESSNSLLKNFGNCHPEESRSDRDDEGSLYLPDFTNAEILREVYPERILKKIPRFAQNDKRRAQDVICKMFFNKLQREAA